MQNITLVHSDDIYQIKEWKKDEKWINCYYWDRPVVNKESDWAIGVIQIRRDDDKIINVYFNSYDFIGKYANGVYQDDILKTKINIDLTLMKLIQNQYQINNRQYEIFICKI